MHNFSQIQNQQFSSCDDSFFGEWDFSDPGIMDIYLKPDDIAATLAKSLERKDDVPLPHIPKIPIIKLKKGVYICPQHVPSDINFYKDILPQIEPIDKLPFVLGYWLFGLSTLKSHPSTRFVVFVLHMLGLAGLNCAGHAVFAAIVGPFLSVVLENFQNSGVFTFVHESFYRAQGLPTPSEVREQQQLVLEQMRLAEEARLSRRSLKHVIVSSALSYGISYAANFIIPGAGHLAWWLVKVVIPGNSGGPGGLPPVAQPPGPVPTTDPRITVTLPPGSSVMLPPGWPHNPTP